MANNCHSITTCASEKYKKVGNNFAFGMFLNQCSLQDAMNIHLRQYKSQKYINIKKTTSKRYKKYN
jgi:hypothetical protein